MFAVWVHRRLAPSRFPASLRTHTGFGVRADGGSDLRCGGDGLIHEAHTHTARSLARSRAPALARPRFVLTRCKANLDAAASSGYVDAHRGCRYAKEGNYRDYRKDKRKIRGGNTCISFVVPYTIFHYFFHLFKTKK